MFPAGRRSARPLLLSERLPIADDGLVAPTIEGRCSDISARSRNPQLSCRTRTASDQTSPNCDCDDRLRCANRPSHLHADEHRREVEGGLNANEEEPLAHAVTQILDRSTNPRGNSHASTRCGATGEPISRSVRDEARDPQPSQICSGIGSPTHISGPSGVSASIENLSFSSQTS